MAQSRQLLSVAEAPILWHGLVGKALPFSLGTVVLGLATAAALSLDAYRVARVLVAAETACIFIAWGVAQWPYLIVPDVTVDSAASPASVLGPTLIVSLVGLVLVIPSLWFLLRIFKTRPRTPGPETTVASFVATMMGA